MAEEAIVTYSKDSTTGTKLAMKRIRVSGRVDDEFYLTMKRRISREAIIWHSFCHRNVLEFLGMAKLTDETYLVSPWMELGDLYSFVTSRLEFFQWDQGKQDGTDQIAALCRRFKEQDAITGIASGLAYLHANNVIHGDMKASNVLLDGELNPKICDFGLTKVMHTEYALTSAGLKGFGTIRWMSPELLTEESSAVKTTAGDVYAFGMTIFEILSAQSPFSNLHSLVYIALVIAAGERPRPEPLSRESQQFQDLWSLGVSCWAPDQRSRPTADDVVATLTSDDWSERLGVGHITPYVAAVGASNSPGSAAPSHVDYALDFGGASL
ncbi:hypothetical protein FRB95_002831 [Tulasnella sp. JGI-2019a]|nr:hypothetical protein FRB95_002831 [Tulasnella sp. JGI-2019a]